MRDWDARRIAEIAGARLIAQPAAHPDGHGPRGASVDTREMAPGELFVGLRGEREDGGGYGAQALAGGAWGVLLTPAHARTLAAGGDGGAGGVVLAHEDPLAALQTLARAWRRELASRGAKVVAITGSTGKTSTKDILAALLGARLRVAASPANRNTEIGLPLALLAAPGDVQVVVLEMAMRGAGQIAQLTQIAEPDVGVIVNIGPAHLGLLGSLEAIAAAKAELIAGLAPDAPGRAHAEGHTASGTPWRAQAGRRASVVVPADEPLLAPHLRADVRTITFGDGGDVQMVEQHAGDAEDASGASPIAVEVTIAHGDQQMQLRPSFAQAHNLRNLLAAVAAARALGHTPSGPVEVEFSAMRGQRERLASGALLIDDCYNANPMSMRAAIDDLAATAVARRVAVLGDMLELGPDARRLHREIGEHAHARGVELLVTVGPLAAEMSVTFAGECVRATDAPAAAQLLGEVVRDGDAVLVKGSRGVGLERVVLALRRAGERPLAASAVAPGRR